MFVSAWTTASTSSSDWASSSARVPQAIVPSRSQAALRNEDSGAVGTGKLAPGRQLLEDGHSPPGSVLRLVPSADNPERPRQRTQRVSLLAGITDLSVTLERLPVHVDRLRELPDRAALARATRRGAPPAPRAGGRAANRSARAYWAAASRCAPTEAARTAASGAKRSTASASSAASAWWASRATSGAPSDRLASAASAFLWRASFALGGSDSSTARRASSWRNATPPGAGVSMPAARHSSSRSAALSRDSVEEPELGLRRRDRDRLEQRPRRGADARHAGEHRVTDRGRGLALSGSQHLGDEEGVAGGRAVELVRVEPVRLGELRDGHRRERRECQAADLLAAAQLSEHDPKRVPAVELVVSVAGER